MEIHLDISFPHMPCDLLSLDVMDVSGDLQASITHGLVQTRLDKNGRVLDRNDRGTVWFARNTFSRSQNLCDLASIDLTGREGRPASVHRSAVSRSRFRQLLLQCAPLRRGRIGARGKVPEFKVSEHIGLNQKIKSDIW